MLLLLFQSKFFFTSCLIAIKIFKELFIFYTKLTLKAR